MYGSTAHTSTRDDHPSWHPGEDDLPDHCYDDPGDYLTPAERAMLEELAERLSPSGVPYRTAAFPPVREEEEKTSGKSGEFVEVTATRRTLPTRFDPITGTDFEPVELADHCDPAPPGVERVVGEWAYRVKNRIRSRWWEPAELDRENDANRLAWTLKRLGFRVTDDWCRVGEFAYACGRAGVPVHEHAPLLTAAWDACRGDEMDTLALAMANADLDQRLFPDLPPRQAWLLACAYWLRELNRYPGRTRVPFGSQRLADHLGCSRDTIDDDIGKLDRAGHVAVAKIAGRTAYSWKGGNAREVAYRGHELGTASPDQGEHQEGGTVFRIAEGSTCKIRRPGSPDWKPFTTTRDLTFGLHEWLGADDNGGTSNKCIPGKNGKGASRGGTCG